MTGMWDEALKAIRSGMVRTDVIVKRASDGGVVIHSIFKRVKQRSPKP